MKYKTYLRNKNLSKSTINTYLKQKNNWENYLSDRNPNKRIFVQYINKYTNNYSPNTTKLVYSSILSFFKFQKKWKLYNECKDIRLPSIIQMNKITITIDEYDNNKNYIKQTNWYEKRDWLIFSFLFSTGIRVNEINQINKKNIKNSQLKIIGKGNKTRIIYISKNLQYLLDDWRANRINISKKNKVITNKQINIIIKKIGIDYFNKNISAHSLRRSYATNLLRKKVDIKTVSINPTTGCLICLKISGQIDLDLINSFTPCQICSKCFGFWVISQKLHVTTMFYF